MPSIPLAGPRLALAFVLAVFAGCTPDAGAPAPLPAAPDTAAAATLPADAVVGETVYVPVYSHIFHQDGTRELDLTVTLSIRNSDPDRALTVAEVGYYDSAGRLVRRYGDGPFRLPALASEAFVVEARDRTGGVGANFLVTWHAEAAVSAPVVEAVMVSTAQALGISMVSRGEVVRVLGGDGAP